MLNDESVTTAADAVARRLLAGDASGNQESLVHRMGELVLGGPLTAEDQADLLDCVRRMKVRMAAAGDQDAELHAWSMACHALFASSRFQFVD